MEEQKHADIEVLKKTATTYLARSTAEVKQIAVDSFNKYDADGNGKITLEEYLKITGVDAAEDKAKEITLLFKKMDANGDGTLDFDEFVTLFFVSMSSVCKCAGCAKWLVNIYFTCSECFMNTSNSYDLCADCYSRGNFSHSHTLFLDNFYMLKHYKSNVREAELNSKVNKLVDNSAIVRPKHLVDNSAIVRAKQLGDNSAIVGATQPMRSNVKSRGMHGTYSRVEVGLYATAAAMGACTIM